MAERFLGKKEVEGPIPSLGSVSERVREKQAEIAQLVEHLLCNQEVKGSKPFLGSEN